MHSNKVCLKCQKSFPNTTEYFYRHKACKNGLNPRCKSCVGEDNKQSFIKAKKRAPERIKKQNREKALKHYYKDIERSRKLSREAARRARADPRRRAIIYCRKRAGGAGLTPEQWDTLFQAQARRCAICRADTPGAKHGWNTDHCHATNKVRFILCAHCNRGLGAFKDNPTLMRQAADILEIWQTANQQHEEQPSV